jgi:hypothetical protein
MNYNAYFSLESVKVIRSDGEDGEYSFRIYYKNQLYDIINTPDDVNDGSEWRPNAVSYAAGSFNSSERFILKLESIEYDGGFRLGDGVATVEKTFGINDKGLHKVYMKDSDNNEVEFRISIFIQVIHPGLGGTVPPPLKTEAGLLGVMLFEDYEFNKNVQPTFDLLHKPRAQRFAVGDYDLPFEQSFRTGGRWGGFGRVLGVRPSTVSSIKIGAGYYLELYDDFGKRGQKITLNENTPVMPVNWNDKVKSISVNEIPRPR